MDFANKNIVITGATSGIGEAIAYRLADKKANLMLLGRNVEKLVKVNDACRQKGVSTEFRQVDMSQPKSIEVFAKEAKAKGWQFDCLILNAGISQRALALDTDIAVDRLIMETDYFGPVYFTKQLAWMLKQNKPINIAVTNSISGLFGFSLRSAYCGAKHALLGFFESLEMENPNIRVTFLIPGRINTQISKSAVLADGSKYAKMDEGQATGISVEKCARQAVRAIEKGRRRKLIGGSELLMVYFKKWCPSLFWWLAKKVSAT